VSADRLGWVILTMGDRWPATTAAIASLERNSPGSPIVLVLNGVDASQVPDLGTQVDVVELETNVGVPAGRDRGLQSLGSQCDYVGFLDDDAVVLTQNLGHQVNERFNADPSLAVVTMRIVDPGGETARRHIPRAGRAGEHEPGGVATFLGGASIVRRSAYEEVGSYWGDLFYAHEELDLAWRLIDQGYQVQYVPSFVVEHPKTPISRHGSGWERTGRNRVRVARRNLPAPVLAIHTLIWLALGVVRAPGAGCKKAYVLGWIGGWRGSVDRAPMSWSTVIELARLGRPPLI
jgi:GT2 family glycosyltransferase